MKKNEILNIESVAYYSGLNGLEIKSIEDDFVYCVTGAWGGPKKPHCCKIYYNAAGEPYFKVNGYRVPFDECVRMGCGWC